MGDNVLSIRELVNSPSSTVSRGVAMNQENTPLVTAVVPVYNHERYVVESIRSILSQSYRNIELIVINDGSKDRSNEMVLTLVEECRHRFVRFEYINRENRGVSATLNQALGMAGGKYFSALASDDVALPDKFSLLVEALESKNDTYAAAFGNALFIDGDSHQIQLDVSGTAPKNKGEKTCSTFLDFYTRFRNFDYRSKEFGTYRTLIAANYLPAMSNMVKTRLIREAGGWTDNNIVDDWEMWLKLSRKYNLLFVDKPLALYRMHGLNTRDTIGHKMVYSAFALVAREKEFCMIHHLRQVWERSFNEQLYRVLRDREITLSRKLREVISARKVSLGCFLLRKIGNKVIKAPVQKT